LNIKDIFYKWSYFFSNALGILVYINLNNILYKEHVISGGKINTYPYFIGNALFLLIRKILKTSNKSKTYCLDWLKLPNMGIFNWFGLIVPLIEFFDYSKFIS
jgi:hypothetical protein